MMQLLVFISVNVELIPIIRKFRKGFQVHICSKMNGFRFLSSKAAAGQVEDANSRNLRFLVDFVIFF